MELQLLSQCGSTYKWPEQIRPGDTLERYWNVQQAEQIRPGDKLKRYWNVKQAEQIRPGDTLKRYWNVKQAEQIRPGDTLEHYWNVNPYSPDVAHHIINQLSKSLLRTRSALVCEADESGLWGTFGPNSPSTQQICMHSLLMFARGIQLFKS